MLFAVVLWLYDSMAFGHDKRLAALAIGLPAFALANGGLLTCLLTNGIGLAMLLVYLMPLATHEKLGILPCYPFRRYAIAKCRILESSARVRSRSTHRVVVVRRELESVHRPAPARTNCAIQSLPAIFTLNVQLSDQPPGHGRLTRDRGERPWQKKSIVSLSWAVQGIWETFCASSCQPRVRGCIDRCTLVRR